MVITFTIAQAKSILKNIYRSKHPEDVAMTNYLFKLLELTMEEWEFELLIAEAKDEPSEPFDYIEGGK